VKRETDNYVLQNRRLLDNESYFEDMLVEMVIERFWQKNIQLDNSSADFVNKLVVKEYMDDFYGRARGWA
jgi:type I restriction enzyme R subunit